MPTLMDKLAGPASALYKGNLHDQLKRVKRNLDELKEQYAQKLSLFDALQKQQEEQLDKIKIDLSKLFTKIKEQNNLYSNIQNNIASFTGKAEGRIRKRKTKLKKIYRRKNKKRTKKRR